MLSRIFGIIVALTLLSGIISCNLESKENFGIYLADTGELVLSERHVAAYQPDDNTFELNIDGIKQWNSYMVYTDIPKLNDTLFNREFIIKIEGKEICSGKFWSLVSSTLVSGITITETLFKLDGEHNLLWIRATYPGESGKLDRLISIELESLFKERDKLN